MAKTDLFCAVELSIRPDPTILEVVAASNQSENLKPAVGRLYAGAVCSSRPVI